MIPLNLHDSISLTIPSHECIHKDIDTLPTYHLLDGDFDPFVNECIWWSCRRKNECEGTTHSKSNQYMVTFHMTEFALQNKVHLIISKDLWHDYVGQYPLYEWYATMVLFMTCTQEVPSPNSSQEPAIVAEVFHSFPQSLHDNSRIVP